MLLLREPSAGGSAGIVSAVRQLTRQLFFCEFGVKQSKIFGLFKQAKVILHNKASKVSEYRLQELKRADQRGRVNKIRELFRPGRFLKLEETGGESGRQTANIGCLDRRKELLSLSTCLIPFDAVCRRGNIQIRL